MVGHESSVDKTTANAAILQVLDQSRYQKSLDGIFHLCHHTKVQDLAVGDVQQPGAVSLSLEA